MMYSHPTFGVKFVTTRRTLRKFFVATATTVACLLEGAFRHTRNKGLETLIRHESPNTLPVCVFCYTHDEYSRSCGICET